MPREGEAEVWGEVLGILPKNLLIALLLGVVLPRLHPLAPRLYLLLMAGVTGWTTTPAGLPHAGVYALGVLPVAMGELLGFTLAALGRVFLALLVLLLSGVLEGWVIVHLL